MRLGVHLVNFSLPGGPESIAPTLAATGRAAEEAGVDNLSFMDHYFQLDFISGAGEPMLEGYTSLGFLAAHTSRVELQVLMTGVTSGTPGCSPRSCRRSMCSPGGVRPSASGRPGTSGSTAASACPSRHSRNASNDWRRPSRSCTRCGATRTGPTTASTTSSRRRSTRHSRSGDRTRRSWSAAAVSGRPSGWSRSTPTPATSSRAATLARTRSRTSSLCCASGATGRDVRTTTSAGPCSTTAQPSTTPPAPPPSWRRCALAHPDLAGSRVNGSLADAVRDLEGVTVRDLAAVRGESGFDVAEEQRLLVAHDTIVLQFPWYRYSVPGILKEWMDQVLLHGFAYGR